MEKELHPDHSSRRILITGPESTGKSELAVALAVHFGGTCIPEYAREYVEKLTRPYEYRDVEHIARRQLQDFEDTEEARAWLFFDTWLIITKVWFEVVYGAAPAWIEEKIRSARFDLVLLCNTDIRWIPDPVRENGGAMRERLLEKYVHELDRYHLNWSLVTGIGDTRIRHAIELINQHLPHVTS